MTPSPVGIELQAMVKPLTDLQAETKSEGVLIQTAILGAAAGLVAVSLLRIEESLRTQSDVGGVAQSAVNTVVRAVRAAIDGLKTDIVESADMLRTEK